MCQNHKSFKIIIIWYPASGPDKFADCFCAVGKLCMELVHLCYKGNCSFPEKRCLKSWRTQASTLTYLQTSQRISFIWRSDHKCYCCDQEPTTKVILVMCRQPAREERLICQKLPATTSGCGFTRKESSRNLSKQGSFTNNSGESTRQQSESRDKTQQRHRAAIL